MDTIYVSSSFWKTTVESAEIQQQKLGGESPTPLGRENLPSFFFWVPMVKKRKKAGQFSTFKEFSSQIWESGSPNHQMWLPFVGVRIEFEMALDERIAT